MNNTYNNQKNNSFFNNEVMNVGNAQVNYNNQFINQGNFNNQNAMMNNQMNYNNEQINMTNQASTSFQNNQGNYVNQDNLGYQNNQANMMYQYNGQFIQNNSKPKDMGTFGGLCVSSLINFIIFTVAVFLFGGLLYSLLLGVFGLEGNYRIIDLMEIEVANKFYKDQIFSSVLYGVVYGGLYMIYIKYIVKSRLKKKDYSLQNIKKYKIIAILMVILMTGILNFSIISSLSIAHENAIVDVSNVPSYYDTGSLDKVLASYGVAELVACVIIGVFAVLTIILSLNEIKKKELIANSNISNNILNNTYI